METKKIILIPDVHGRGFWRDAVKGNEDERIIFLGDYHDPYLYEGVSYEESLQGLLDIIEFKKQHQQNVTLLLGNHDLGYLDTDICNCRRDIANARLIHDTFVENMDLFDICCIEQLGEQRALFSHAGVNREWADWHKDLFGGGVFNPIALNGCLHTEDVVDRLLDAMSDVSYVRGGYSPYGSPVWADAREWNTENGLEGYIQVVGHTQLRVDYPIFTDGVLITDCRRAFEFTSENFSSYLKEPERGN